MSRLYGIPLLANGMDTVAAIARARGPRTITGEELPDLVTFENVNDPKSVLSVNQNDLQATLGSAVSWNEITLESTDEPITTGLKRSCRGCRHTIAECSTASVTAQKRHSPTR